MTLYQILSLLGVPAILALLFKYFQNRVLKTLTDSMLMKEGLQALLRSQMIADYNKWIDRGYAPIYAKDNFENCWGKYHLLGANGVIDDLHDKFMELPTEEK